jgi:hypothetical protein
MISEFSRKLEKAEINYTTTEKELLSIVKSCEHFRYYLLGKKFVLKTDHKSLIYLKTMRDIIIEIITLGIKVTRICI